MLPTFTHDIASSQSIPVGRMTSADFMFLHYKVKLEHPSSERGEAIDEPFAAYCATASVSVPVPNVPGVFDLPARGE